MNNKHNETPLDDYEKELKAFLDKGKYTSLPKKQLKKENEELKEVAKRYFRLKASKKVTLRIKNENLIKVKTKAKKVGIPYQRIINTLIDRYANNKIKIAI